MELTTQLDLKKDEEMFSDIQSIRSKSFKKESFCRRLIKCLFCFCYDEFDQTSKRIIAMNEERKNKTYFKNNIKNQKYNILTFIPLVLYHQFKFFSNQFYLLMVVSQFIDALKVGFLFSYVAPLLFVLLVTLVKEAIDEINRYKRDKEENNQTYTKYDKKGVKKIIKSAEIKVGDLIELNQNNRIPADMVVLKSLDENGSLFIRTDQLDGETDWKLRKAIPTTQKFEFEYLHQASGYLIVDPPSKQIYDFQGIFKFFNENHQKIKESLSLENTMWANTILASKKVVGIVIFTGKETRAQMNSSLPRSKVGVLDLEINKLNIILFIVMMFSSFLLVVLKGFSPNIMNNFIVFFRFIVLLCAIIPISLRVNHDISKAVNSLFINNNEHIPETIVRNSTIPEELGRIEFVFSDKTGTLTKNEMIFKKLVTETDEYSADNMQDLGYLLVDECNTTKAPLYDLFLHSEKGDIDFTKKIRRNKNKVVRDAITAMALCNNVTPIYDENNKIDYQASSPDEVALVQIANGLKMRLSKRTEKEITILNAADKEETYEILANFPFSSDSKRMGILLRNTKFNFITYYLKGAESVIEKFVKEEYKNQIKEHAENLAVTGLRTLVLTQKFVTNDFYNIWIKSYNDALTSLDDRQEKINEVRLLLENNMEFLAVTGVEDLLQDEVAETIDALAQARIKVWMLTGDKVETATCIAISCRLKTPKQREYYIKENPSIAFVEERLTNFKNKPNNDEILIIDGICLEVALLNLEKLFFEAAMRSPSVVCCRCSPTQKAIIVRTIKKYTTKRTLAIGDGGNDVAMIQESHLGVGIKGKEGMQASLAADYSISKFKHLKLLLLWFGRISYKNTALISNFVIHRGLIISFIQMIFSILFYCSSVPIYNGILILGYSTIYTNLPVISLIYDRDTNIKNVLDFPNLYSSLQKGRLLSIKNFLLWFQKSLFQAAIIMIGAVLLFDNVFLYIVTITFTSLIIAELLNVYTEIRTYHHIMAFSLIFTLTIYILSIVFLNTILDVYFVLDPIYFIKTLGLTLASWLPFYIYERIRVKFYPEDYEKI